MKKVVNKLLSFSFILFLLVSCVGSKSSSNEGTNLSLLKEFLELLEKEDSTSEEELTYVDFSNINQDLYDILSYKEKSVRSTTSEDYKNNSSKINFSLDNEEDGDWKSIPTSGKIEKKKDMSLIFSLKGAVVIGQLDVEKTNKKDQKVTLKSIMGGEKEVRNFKYLVLSLSSEKSGKLKIDPSDIKKLKSKKIDFSKEPEDFVKEPDVKEALEGKTKASQEDIFGYDVDEAVLVKNLKDKLDQIISIDIKEIDGLSESIDIYASDVSEPKFDSNPYTIRKLKDIEITYIKDSFKSDDLKGSLSYEVNLAVPRLDDDRKIKVSYSGFKSTSERQNKLNSIVASDIKLIDGITRNPDLYAIEYKPNFDSNPYTIKGLNNITVNLVKRKNSLAWDGFVFQGVFHYRVELSAPKLQTRNIAVVYYNLRSAYREHHKYVAITSSQIKALDAIAVNQETSPSKISSPRFSGLYTVNGLKNSIKITYIDNSLTSDDNQGLLSYKVKISFPYLKKFYSSSYHFDPREFTVNYTGFKRYITATTSLERSGGSKPVKLTTAGDKAVASSGGNIEIWDISTGSLLKKFRSHNSIASIAISSDDSKIASVAGRQISVKIHDFNGNLLREISGFRYLGEKVEFSPDGTKIVVGGFSRGEPFQVFNVSDGTVFQTLKGHTHYVNSVKFPSNDTVISGSADKTIKIWNIADGSVVRTIDTKFFVYDIDVSSDGSKVAAVGYSTSVKIWDISSGSLLRSVSGFSDSYDGVASVKFSPDNQSIVAGDAGSGGHVGIWKISDDSLLKSWKAYSVDSSAISGIYVDISSDSKKVFSSSPYGKIKVWKDIRDIPLTQ